MQFNWNTYREALDLPCSTQQCCGGTGMVNDENAKCMSPSQLLNLIVPFEILLPLRPLGAVGYEFT